jgi:hypothetical protein
MSMRKVCTQVSIFVAWHMAIQCAEESLSFRIYLTEHFRIYGIT